MGSPQDRHHVAYGVLTFLLPLPFLSFRPSAPLSLRLRLSSPPRCVGGVCSLFLLGSRWNCRRRLSLLLNQPNSWAVAQATRGVREKRTDSEKFYGSGAVAYTAVITQR